MSASRPSPAPSQFVSFSDGRSVSSQTLTLHCFVTGTSRLLVRVLLYALGSASGRPFPAAHAVRLAPSSCSLQ